MTERCSLERSEALVYRIEGASVRFLVVSSRKDPQLMVLPGGRIERGETPEDAARREVREEAGVRIDIERCLGSLLREKGNGRLYSTAVFLARMIGAGLPGEPRIVKWVEFEQLQTGRLYLPRDYREAVAEAHAAMRVGK